MDVRAAAGEDFAAAVLEALNALTKRRESPGATPASAEPAADRFHAGVQGQCQSTTSMF
jgi:hypothetical protein